MNPNAFKRYKYSADFYNFLVEEVGDDIKVNYFYAGKIFLTADLDDNQRITFFSKEPLPIGSLVANVKDARGDLILDDLIWQIATLSPIFDVFNSIQNYRSRATVFQGELNVLTS